MTRCRQCGHGGIWHASVPPRLLGTFTPKEPECTLCTMAVHWWVWSGKEERRRNDCPGFVPVE
jgi:hypothetical protein